MEKKHIITQRVVEQPVDHARSDGETFRQYVDVLVPNSAPANAAVFFILGFEGDLTQAELERIYRNYGAPADVIFIQAEHRGYGESISNGDQSVPAYVTVEQALADFHRVVEILKPEYPGPWLGAGYSYAGGLVIEYAARYPADFAAILSSSGVVDWPFTMDAYDRKVRVIMGAKTYANLARHVRNLEPKELFDANWLEREFMIALIHGVSQYIQYKPYLPIFKFVANLPTSTFLAILHGLDNAAAKGLAWYYALSNSRKTLSREEALTMNYTLRTWRYQQCNETGVFETSAEPGGIFNRTRADFSAEAKALFGEDQPRAAHVPSWSPRKALERLTVPLVYVAGELDPWEGLGVERDYPLKRGKYFFIPAGKHCHDSYVTETGREVFAALLKFAKGE